MGDTLTRHELCAEAIRLCRVLVALLPRSAEALGLLALMLLHNSRREHASMLLGTWLLSTNRIVPAGIRQKIRDGTAILDEALALNDPGPYQAQAAISALHAEALTAKSTDWRQIAALYDSLARMAPSTVVEVNRAVAVAMAKGTQAGLHMLLRLEGQAASYYPYHAARAVLRRDGQSVAAAEAYQWALDLCQNSAERVYLQRRLDEILNR